MSHTTLEKSSVFLSPSVFKVVRSVPSSASVIMVILPSTCNEIEFLLMDCIESLSVANYMYEEIFMRLGLTLKSNSVL